ncbi:MAG: hypothetical protein ACYCQJ_06930 [Nitrososphaerales archaeon]
MSFSRTTRKSVVTLLFFGMFLGMIIVAFPFMPRISAYTYITALAHNSGCNGQSQYWTGYFAIPSTQSGSYPTSQVALNWDWQNPISVGYFFCSNESPQAAQLYIQDHTTGNAFCVPAGSDCGSCTCGLSGATGSGTYTLCDAGANGCLAGTVNYGDVLSGYFTVYYAFWTETVQLNGGNTFTAT